MGTPYAGADTFPANINLLTDDDAQLAASYNPGTQQLADRTTYLAARLLAGVPIVQYQTSIANMAALAGQTANSVCLVNGHGLFYYLPNSGSVTPVGELVVASTAVTNARWLRADWVVANQQHGYPVLNADKQVDISAIPNATTDKGNLYSTARISDNLTGGDDRTITNSGFTFTCLASDTLHLLIGPIRVTNAATSPGAASAVYLMHNENGGASAASDAFSIAGDYDLPLFFSHHHRVTTAGVVNFWLRGVCNAGAAMSVSSLRGAGDNKIGTYHRFQP
jgi:hypothetical protein